MQLVKALFIMTLFTHLQRYVSQCFINHTSCTGHNNIASCSVFWALLVRYGLYARQHWIAFCHGALTSDDPCCLISELASVLWLWRWSTWGLSPAMLMYFAAATWGAEGMFVSSAGGCTSKEGFPPHFRMIITVIQWRPNTVSEGLCGILHALYP